MFSKKYYVFLLVVICAISTAFLKHLWQETTDIVQSPADKREYSYYQLDNGLKVLLVTDSKAKKASAALSVDVGSGDDPIERQGIAHFLEHMLFLGTKPYPKAEAYQAYINRHGGFNNAFTAFRQTTYYFSVDNNALEGALDRFAPFFISPLFSAKYVERERQAVEAEYRARIRNDFRRVYAAKKQAYNRQHPSSKFSVGALETLSDTKQSLIRDDVIAFYKSHYSSHRMSLVVAGNYPQAKLKEWVNARFAAIPKRNLAPRSASAPLLIESKRAHLLQVKPIKNTRSLNFVFPMPETDSLYAYKPIGFIAHLIGHEGEGSLLDLFKQQGWAEGLSASKGFNSAFLSTLEVHINLTEEGLEHIEDITQALFAYCKLLYKTPNYLIKEQQALAELAFKFEEQQPLSKVVTGLSGRLLRYPAKDVLYANYRQEQLTADMLKPFLDKIQPNNMLRTLIAPEAKTKAREKWYQTPYSLEQVALNIVALPKPLLAKLHLPKPNPFIPENLSINPAKEQQQPSILQQTKSMQAWYYPEHLFNAPKTIFVANLQTNAIRQQVKARVLASLLARTLGENLNTYSYPAMLSGLSFQLSADTGIQIELSGYQDKMPILLDKIISSLTHLSLTDEQFVRYKKSLQRELENAIQQSPYTVAISRFSNMLQRPQFDEQDWLLALKPIVKEEVLEFAKQIKQQAYATVLIHTTSSRDKAQVLLNKLSAFLPAKAEPVKPLDIVVLPAQSYQKELNLPHKDKLYASYIQGENTSDELRAQYALLGSILSAPYYQSLRTEQQLGYIVFATQYPQKNVPALLLLLQSPNASPAKIKKASDLFLKEFTQKLNNITASEFKSYQQGLVNHLLKPVNNMQQHSQQFWQALQLKEPRFNERQVLADAIKNSSLQQVQELYAKIINNKSKAQLIFTQGGKLKQIPSMDSLDKDKLEVFE